MNKIIELLLFRLSHIGEIPLCNGVAIRAPHIFGFCFPFCYRCTFILIFFFIAIWIWHKYRKQYKLWMLVVCLFPMIIDGVMQTFFSIESTNFRRSITGTIFGFALGMIVARLYVYIDEKA